MIRPYIDVEKVYKQFRLKRPRKTAFSSLRETLSGAGRGSSYKKYWAIEDISLKAEPGDRIGLIGNNGAGKTTLLKIIAGLYMPTAGSVDVKGEARLFTSLGLGITDELTVSENIYLYGAICGLTERYIKHKFHEILAFAGLADFANSRVKTLSTGMVQRLGFSVAMHVRSDILLFDEALSMGDKNFQVKSDKVLESYKNSEMIVIMASHNLEYLARFCEKILWLEKGKQMAFGPAKEVIEKYLQHNNKGPE
jgi:ABC-type polysaccharide/polyol phosphate transport system ATPase subunit